MNRTFTPVLSPDVASRLEAYAGLFADLFPMRRQAAWSLAYLRGLLQDGERKSIEPMVARLDLPPELRVKNPDQCLQNFVNQADWDEQAVWRRYRAVMAETFADPAAIFVIDDTTFPKQGRHSVGVQRQHCGALGKTANCQCAVSLHYVSPAGHYPLDMRLYLPESWLGDPKRLDVAQVPEGERRPLTKGQIALELLDRTRGEGLPGAVVVADAGYGIAQDLRDGLAERGLHYVVGVTDQMVVFAEEPRWIGPRPVRRGGRPPTRPRLAADSPRPVCLKELAGRLPREAVSWRRGTKADLTGKFAWVRVWPASGWAIGDCVGVEPIWLLIEEQADGTLKYAFSNLPQDTPRDCGVRLWHSRWPVEQGYQQMKEELGLDHFEGRSWRGLHHHACLVMLALGFLVLERLRVPPAVPAKKGGPGR
jgi:SRSO17 transposase